MNKKVISFLTSAMLLAALPAAYAADPVFDQVLYSNDFSDCRSFADANLARVAGAWTIEQGTEGRPCLVGRLADGKNSVGVMLGQNNWENCQVTVEYKVIQDADVAFGNDNQLVETIYTRCDDKLELDSGNFVKYMYRNPMYYSNYFGGYSKNGTKNLGIIDNKFKSGDDITAAPQKNVMQKMVVSDYNSPGTGGATITHKTSFNDEYTSSITEWAGSGSGILTGKIGIEFKSAVNNGIVPAYFEIYRIEVLGTDAYAPEPQIQLDYNGTLYDNNFIGAASLEAAGLTVQDGTWTIEEGTEGRTCLKGVLKTGTADGDGIATDVARLKFGNNDWQDCTIEMEYKLVQAGNPAPSKDKTSGGYNDLEATVYTRSIDKVASGNFIKYMLRNPAYYSNFLGVYSRKDNAGNPAIIKDKDSNAEYKSADAGIAVQNNTVQTIKIMESNEPGTSGTTIHHSIQINGGEALTCNEWVNNTSGILTGAAGLEFKNVHHAENVQPFTVEIYELKVTGNKKADITYLNQNGGALQTIPASGTIQVKIKTGSWDVDGQNCRPVIISAVYDGNTLADCQMIPVSQDLDKDYAMTLNTPENPENCIIKTMVVKDLQAAQPMAPVTVFPAV